MRVFTFLIAIFLFSCNSHQGVPDSANKADTQNAATVADTQKIQPADSTLKDLMRDTVKNEATLLYIWAKDFDKKTKEKNPYLKKQYQHVDSIIKGLNESNPGIKLEKIKFSGDTLYTEIRNSEYLGEQMGSTGAEAYFAEAIAWDADRVAMKERSVRIAWRVAALSSSRRSCWRSRITVSRRPPVRWTWHRHGTSARFRGRWRKF